MAMHIMFQSFCVDIDIVLSFSIEAGSLISLRG